MALPRPARPSALWRDLRAFLGGEQRHKALFAVVAVLMPVVIVYGFIRDGHTNIMPGRQIVYAYDWPADRTDEQIKAQQKIDQAKREADQRERQKAYQRLEKQLGIE